MDNPFWSSLTTVHRAHAIERDGVVRFPADMAPFLAIAEPRPISAATLDALVDGETYLLGPRPSLAAPYRLDELGVITQMICDTPQPVPDGPEIMRLTDHQPIRDLAALVYPHYFRHRTAELGRYHGIRGPGRLDAMIGERMAMPGLREISAVCTHPACVGRGLARRLLAHASNAIFAAGETPFLHVSPANTRALQLYEQNGYRRRIDVPFWSLRRATRSPDPAR
jgi:GNAT superfamily N-acetyltransferase